MKTNLPIKSLMQAYEVRLHYKRPVFETMAFISCAEDAVRYLRQNINPEQLDLQECFWVLLLTNANRILAISKVASGTSKGVQTNPKGIFQLALLANASAIIVAHNHPSGTLKISERDSKETKKIKRLAALMDITLLDHIIITSESFMSFSQEHVL